MKAAFAEVLPDYDRDRVHVSDMKKVFMWYNILLGAGFTEFKLPETEEEPVRSPYLPSAAMRAAFVIKIKFGGPADSFFVLFLSPVAMHRCPIPLFYRGGRGRSRDTGTSVGNDASRKRGILPSAGSDD